MIPDLPMPVRMTRPRQVRRSATARSNRSSSRSTSARIAAASVCRTFRASARAWLPVALSTLAMQPSLGALGDRVDRGQPFEQRRQQIEAECVLRVAFRTRRILVHLEEHAVDAGGNAGRREWLDVLRKTGGNAFTAAGKLQAVGHVKDYDRPFVAHH